MRKDPGIRLQYLAGCSSRAAWADPASARQRRPIAPGSRTSPAPSQAGSCSRRGLTLRVGQGHLGWMGSAPGSDS